MGKRWVAWVLTAPPHTPCPGLDPSKLPDKHGTHSCSIARHDPIGKQQLPPAAPNGSRGRWGAHSLALFLPQGQKCGGWAGAGIRHFVHTSKSKSKSPYLQSCCDACTAPIPPTACTRTFNALLLHYVQYPQCGGWGERSGVRGIHTHKLPHAPKCLPGCHITNTSPPGRPARGSQGYAHQTRWRLHLAHRPLSPVPLRAMLLVVGAVGVGRGGR